MRPYASIIAASLVLTIFLGSALAPAHSTALNLDPNSVGCVGCPSLIGTPWAPYGPLTSQLRFQFYSYPLSESTAFLNGQIDLPDLSVQPCLGPPILVACFSNPDFTTSSSASSGFFGVQFNLQNQTGPGITNTWANWGCNFQHGTSPCGIEIRQAIAHLVSRDTFVSTYIPNQAIPIADPVSPAQDPPGSPLATQCSWDTLFPGNCILAFNLAPDPGGFAQPGSPDFCAAVAHLVNAGIGLTNKQDNCAIDPNSPGLSRIIASPIRFIGRTSDPRRRALEVGLVDAINQVFGVRAAFPCLGVSFGCSPFNHPFSWDMYTFGFDPNTPFADQIDSLFDSLLAGNQCGGHNVYVTDNYAFVCIPSVDAAARAALQTNDPNVFRTDTLAALDQLGKSAAILPIFTPVSRSIALTDMAGLVDQKGTGFPNYWSALNGRNNSLYTPANSIYKFGGGTDTLRWGQAEGTSFLNPYQAQTFSEANVLGEVYDSLFRASPAQPTNVLCWMCDTYTQYTDGNGNNHFQVQLRQTLRWQDGAVVDSKDVKFSLLTMRDLSSLGFGALNVLNVQIISPTILDITMKGVGVSQLTDLATVLIVPRHIWELPGDTTYGDVGTVDPAKLNPSYDPITSGTFIGSGPFVCRSVFPLDIERVGTGCSQDQFGSRIGQSIDTGSITLQRYDMTGQPGNLDPYLQYMRSYNPSWSTATGTAAFSGQFQEFSWADRFNNATVTIRDFAQVAACFGASTPTAACPASDDLGPVFSYWLKPNFHGGTNTIGSEVTVVVAHLDDTWIYPFSWNGVQSQQPGQTLQDIVPFTP